MNIEMNDDLEYDNYYQNNDENNHLDEHNPVFNNYWEISSEPEPEPTIKKNKKVSFPDILSNMNLVVKNGVLQKMGPLSKQTNQYQDNHYFKDYNSMNQSFEPIVQKLLSIKEYHKLIFEQKSKKLLERIRVSKIKSKKLFFTDHNVIQPSSNNLRKMSFG
jgi:hypothetical protein